MHFVLVGRHMGKGKWYPATYKGDSKTSKDYELIKFNSKKLNRSTKSNQSVDWDESMGSHCLVTYDDQVEIY